MNALMLRRSVTFWSTIVGDDAHGPVRRRPTHAVILRSETTKNPVDGGMEPLNTGFFTPLRMTAGFETRSSGPMWASAPTEGGSV